MEYYIAQGTVEEMEDKFNGKEVIEVEVTSKDDFVRHLVKAKISRSLDGLPDAEPLWVRGDGTGLSINDAPWGIEIVEEIEEE
mgnify:CR=1 FL=1